MPKEMLKGNEAMAEAAVRAGLEDFGYPITPQTEILEWLSRRLRNLAALLCRPNLKWQQSIWFMARHDRRARDDFFSPGVSLMMEGLSYIAGSTVL